MSAPDVTTPLWNVPPVAVFDTETTGTDVDSDRIVQAYIGIVTDGGVVDLGSWLINPGVPIPDAAVAVHHITNEHVTAHGVAPADGIPQIAATLRMLVDDGYPLVAYNAPFDLTILDAEARRHIGHGLEETTNAETGDDDITPDPWLKPILDPLVIDKAIDRYRPGSRTLAAVANHYGITAATADLHDARADAVLAGYLMRHLWTTPKINGFPAHHIHERQVDLARAQQESYADHRRSLGDDPSGFRTGWPMYGKGA